MMGRAPGNDRSVRLPAACLPLLALLIGCAATPPAPAAGPILRRLLTYVPPPYPRDTLIGEELADTLAREGKPLPPTPIDLFVVDCHGILELAPTPAIRSIPDVIDYYAEADWKKIPGYRPWTHASFVRSLSDSERAALAVEVTRYLETVGLRRH